MSSALETIRRAIDPLLSGRRFGLFASAGLSGATVDMVGLVVLVELVGLGPVVGKALSWELGVIVVFAINEYWTFSRWGATGTVPLVRRFLRSNLIRLGGFLVTLGILAALVRGFGTWYVLANAAGMAVGFVVNYSLETFYTWRVHLDGG